MTSVSLDILICKIVLLRHMASLVNKSSEEGTFMVHRWLIFSSRIATSEQVG